nr:hypothetical protein CFP56_75287 [Quercus suber]
MLLATARRGEGGVDIIYADRQPMPRDLGSSRGDESDPFTNPTRFMTLVDVMMKVKHGLELHIMYRLVDASLGETDVGRRGRLVVIFHPSVSDRVREQSRDRRRAEMVLGEESKPDCSMKSSVFEERQMDETSGPLNGDLVAHAPATGERENESGTFALPGPEAQAEACKDNERVVDVRSMNVEKSFEHHHLSSEIGLSANQHALTEKKFAEGQVLDGQRFTADHGRNDSGSDDEAQISGRYLNNLHPAVGYLDLANALDFPANVWNSIPIPVFALVLMGLGGSIAILTVGFAVWDYQRSRRNITFLQAERAWLDRQLAGLADAKSDAKLMLQAWQYISFRELGWEAIDRVLMDVSMGVAGILVGTGTLLAIHGDNHAIFMASNLDVRVHRQFAGRLLCLCQSSLVDIYVSTSSAPSVRNPKCRDTVNAAT